jgi:hypothetical protein
MFRKFKQKNLNATTNPDPTPTPTITTTMAQGSAVARKTADDPASSKFHFWGNQSRATLTIPPPTSFSSPATTPSEREQILITEIESLRKALAAEEEFSSKLMKVLQSLHEDAGRINNDPGSLGSEYYHGLRDDDGEPLVREGGMAIDDGEGALVVGDRGS